MTTPDEVRALIASSSERWETITSHGRAWQDRLVGRDAVARRSSNPRAPRVARSHAQLPGGEVAAIGQREQEWSLWRGGAVLLRSEYTIGRETVTVVGQGPRWWRWSPVLGATSGGGVGRPVRLLLGPPSALIDADRLFEHLEFDTIGRATVAGRSAHQVRATPANVRGRARLAFREVGTGADAYEINVDAERGAVLSVTALMGGRPFQIVETTSIEYDAVLAPNLFSPEQSSGERFAPARTPQKLTLDEVAGRVDFTVYAFSPSPSPVEPYVSLFESDRRGFGPRHVVLVYAILDPDAGKGQLRVTQSATQLPASSHDSWTKAGDVEVSEERHARIIRHRVRFRLGETYVELECAIYPVDRIRELAKDLLPLGAAAPSQLLDE